MNLRVDPVRLHDFHSKIACKISMPPTCRRLLEAFAAPDVNTETVAEIVRANQYLEHLLMSEIRSLGLKENTPGLQAAIALLGMSRTRDFVCAVTLVRAIGGWHPTRDKAGKLSIKTAELLRYARRAEAAAGTRAASDPELAFCAGLLFDALAAVGREVFGEPKGFAAALDETFKQGLRAAQLGQALAAELKLPLYSRQLFAACLVHDAGRLAQELLFPLDGAAPYASFRKWAATSGVSRAVAHVAEERRFGLTHEHLGAQLVFRFPRLRALDRAILYQHEPYLLRESNPELWRFAAFIATASSMAGSADAKSWIAPELAGLGFESARLSKVMERAKGAGV